MREFHALGEIYFFVIIAIILSDLKIQSPDLYFECNWRIRIPPSFIINWPRNREADITFDKLKFHIFDYKPLNLSIN